jgi:hypothetical protein
MQHGQFITNRIPRQAGYSPEEMFAKTMIDHTALCNLPVWGCPAYILNPSLQNSFKIPKWEPRSQRGQYMGISPIHSNKTVGIIRNLRTGSISPQYHVVYDPFFTTVHCDETKPPDPNEWKILNDQWRSIADADPDELDNIDLDNEWLTKAEILNRQQNIIAVRIKN